MRTAWLWKASCRYGWLRWLWEPKLSKDVTKVERGVARLVVFGVALRQPTCGLAEIASDMVVLEFRICEIYIGNRMAIVFDGVADHRGTSGIHNRSRLVFIYRVFEGLNLPYIYIMYTDPCPSTGFGIDLHYLQTLNVFQVCFLSQPL